MSNGNMTTDLSMTESQHGEVCVLSLTGRIDSSNAETFMTRLKTIIASGVQTVLIDLAAVKYLTSAAFRALLVANRSIGEKNAASSCAE